ncbi:MAG: glycerol-3-phosphate 1-O-acyltransferase PlsY [Candidatus Fermentibacteraceae bacterium]|nr:glycerol-3-phosphate 1-O-acyltransferase PlsY [Candidatus Fermentibacteraceae bacterium]
MNAAVYILLGFLSGSIPFSWLLGKLKGVDLREHGSGNPGATNLLRTSGTAMGVLGLVLDAAKGAAPVYFAVSAGVQSAWLPSAVVIAAVCGHVFMPWFGFKGGKGVATALGALLVLSTYPVLVALGLFILLLACFKMVSLGSVVAGISLPILGILFKESMYPEIVFSIIAMAILVTHRSNISRILNRTERKIGKK